MSDFWYWSKSRIVSLVIAVIYLVLDLIFLRGAQFIGLMFLIIFSLVCIWFGDEMGGIEGPTSKGYIRKTPGIFMKLGGWALLSLPFILGIIFFIGER